MIYLYSFLFAGIVCLIGEVLMTAFKLKPGVVTSIFVSIGAFLDIFNIYDWFVNNCGAGAMVVITSFGHSLIHGALASTETYGFMGLMMGMFDLTAAGITAAIVFSFLLSLVFKPKH